MRVKSTCYMLSFKSYQPFTMTQPFHFSGAEGCPYEVGDRFAQLTILPIQNVRFEWAPQLSETERGARGYGHTGRR